MKRAGRIVRNPWFLVLLAAAAGATAGSWSSSAVQLGSFFIINVLLAQSINLLTGLIGQISLGHAAFFGIGSYGSAILARDLGLPIPVTLVAAALVAGAFGYLLSFPAGRVKEFYLAMMTLGFGMIFYEVAKEWTGLTGGVMGFSNVPSPELKNLALLGVPIGGLGFFRLMLATLVGVMILLRNFIRSHYGRAFYAVHASELAAGSMGISGPAAKRMGFTLSAVLAGLAGAFYAHLIGYLGPESFGLMKSVECLVMAILGGMGSLFGPVFGAALLTVLPDRLQVFSEYQFMVYGALLLVSFTALPRGLAGLLPGRMRFSKAPESVGGESAPVEPAPAEERQAPPGGTLLEVADVKMNFSGLQALDGVSLTLERGQVMALIGPNGSGKSTLVNVISGIYRPTSGKVFFRGKEITGRRDFEVARTGIVRTFQDPRNVPNFTVRENILLGAHHNYRHGLFAAAVNLPRALREEAEVLRKADEVMEMTGLITVAEEPLASLPYGLQRMTEAARAVVSDPEVVILDEPAAGLSDVELFQLERLIRHLKVRRIGVILIEHHMDFLDALVDGVIVLDSGVVIYRGDMRGMRGDPAVLTAYLGMEDAAGA